MKKFSKVFIFCYIMATIFFIYFFGNMNFFGEQGFHMDMYVLIIILTSWSLISALILSGIICFITSFREKNGENSEKK